ADALALLEEHAALVGENPILHAMRGRAMVYDKREDEGNREFDFAMTHSPNAATLEMVIGHMAAASNMRQAIDTVSARFPITQANASAAWIHLLLVNLEMRLHDYQAAEVRLRQVERLLTPEDPRRLQLDHQLAVIHHFLGRTSEAVSGYRKVLEREADNPQILNNLAYLLCEELNQPKEALE